MYLPLVLLFIGLIIFGTFLTLFLFKFNMKALRESGLDKKIIMWLPFAAIFLCVLYLGPAARAIVFAVIFSMSLYEFFIVHRKRPGKLFLIIYIILFAVSFSHLGLIKLVSPQNQTAVLFLIVGTVISDVTGYFFGSFFGRHKLPQMFNQRKSWEGILGQLAGALIGVALIKYLILNQGNILIFLPIGIGSAMGDLMNSRAKQVADIKNWSNFIPGHGGFLDRFCSLAGSSIFVFYYLLFWN